MSNTELIFSIGGSLIALLLAGNIYFVKRLIDKTDKTDKTATAALALAKAQDKSMMIIAKRQEKTLGEIREELKELRHLEIDVAVLKSCLNLKMGARNLSEKIASAS